MQPLDKRSTILIFIRVTLVAMLLLAVGMPKELSQGEPIPMRDLVPSVAATPLTQDDGGLLAQVIRILAIILWGLIPFYIIYLIISPAARKQFLKDLARLMPFMLLMLALAMWLQNSQRQNGEMEPQPGLHGNNDAAESTGSPLEELNFDPNPPEWLVTATTVGIGVIVTLVLIGAFITFQRLREQRLMRDEPLKKMAREAQSAIDMINMGGDLRDVIIKAYMEMNRIVFEARNLRRGVAMTPHEFELYLAEKGLPSDPIHNLTALFEKVRYGGEKPGRQDETVAITSLTAIVNACRRAT